jgi:hypothetical protein
VGVSIAAPEHSGFERVRATIGVFITLAVVTCAITLLYLGMRAVMSVGGFCAEGGAFQIRQHCPKGIPGLMFGGIWGGLIGLGLYVWQTSKHKVPSLVGLSWSALFLSLGWNFLDYGLRPTPPLEGLQWGWLVCAIVFGLMGGLPLLVVAKPIYKSFFDPGTNDAWTPIVTASTGVGARVASNLAEKVIGKMSTGQTSTTPTGPKWEASGVGDAGGLVAYLERLESLHRSGSLSDEEFAAAKKRVLEGDV